MNNVLVVGGAFREVITGAEQAREVRFAGSALYAAAAASQLGARVTMVAPVGEDDLELAEKLTAGAAIEAHFLVTPGESGTFAYEKAAVGEVLRGYRPATERAGEVDLELGRFEVACVFGHPEWDPLRIEVVEAFGSETTLLFDRQGWLSRSEVRDGARAKAGRGIWLANASEIGTELGPAALTDLGSARPPGYEAAVVKDSRWGVHVVADGGVRSIGARDVRERVTVGSGDVFAGALAAGFEPTDPVPAAEIAVAAAAASISSDHVLPGAEFASLVEDWRGRPELPILPPAARAQCAVVVEHDGELAGQLLVGRVADFLEAEGFSAVRVEQGPSLAVRVGETRFVPEQPGSEGEFLAETLSWVGRHAAAGEG
jgi:hypothetical protein